MIPGVDPNRCRPPEILADAAYVKGTRRSAVNGEGDLLPPGRALGALFGYAMNYKPFYDQLAKREFAVLMRETARGLLETLVIRVLGVAPG